MASLFTLPAGPRTLTLNRMPRHPLTLSLVILGLAALAACSGAPPLPPPVLPDPSSEPLQPPAGCPSDGTATLAPDLDPVDAVTAYLNARGNPLDLAQELYDLGWVAPLSAFIQTDLDGDGLAEIAVGLSAPPDSESDLGLAAIYVWRCHDGTYVAAEAVSQRPLPYGAPVLQEATDLTGDGLPELIAYHPLCGAHTCFADYLVLQWDGQTTVNRLVGPSDDLPSPEWSAERALPGRPSEISIAGRGVSSVGAGPYRIVTRTWEWDAGEEAFIPRADVVEPPRYRIHAVHDADAAFDRGDLPGSLALYERVLNDHSLLEWPSMGGGREALEAYAAYRSVFVYLFSDFPAAAEAEFEARFEGTGLENSPYGELARLLLTRFAEVDLEAACAQVRQRVSADPGSFLGALEYGYENKAYTADDFCRPPLGR